jgi:hypothetical protein
MTMNDKAAKEVRTASIMNDSSSAIALSRNCGSPKGSRLRPLCLLPQAQ